MPKKPDPKSNDLVPRSMLPKRNAAEQRYADRKKDNNPALTKEVAKQQKTLEKIYGSNARKAATNGWQYENGVKNHHTRGQPVDSNKEVLNRDYHKSEK